jgi:RluA family pseudouridine synthase
VFCHEKVPKIKLKKEIQLNDIELLYQGSEVIAVNKPFGVSVHNNEDSRDLIQRLKSQLGSNEYLPVHRLDKETSGIQILALNSVAAKKYAEEFQSREVKKIYTGLVKGKLSQSTGCWSWALTDKAEGRKNPAGLAKGRVQCETHFSVRKSSDYFSWIDFDLKTGRQHQIRKHCAISKHPLIGDVRYGDPKYNERLVQRYGELRMFLHCEKLKILDLDLECPAPAEFGAVFDKSMTNS